MIVIQNRPAIKIGGQVYKIKLCRKCSHCCYGRLLIGDAVIPQVNMNEVKYYIVLFCFGLLFFNCSQPNELDEPIEKKLSKYSIPDSIIHKSNMVIISKVGQPFFDSYIKLDSSNSKFSLPDSFCIKNPSSCADFLVRPYYFMVYRFNFSNNKDYSAFIEFVVDTNGIVVPSRPVFGIPNCPNNNCWGSFQIITKEKAIEIAKQYGFEEGIKEWTVKFHYSAGPINNYVWSIQNTLTEDKSTPNQYRASGKALIINAVDGSIIQVSVWIII